MLMAIGGRQWDGIEIIGQHGIKLSSQSSSRFLTALYRKSGFGNWMISYLYGIGIESSNMNNQKKKYIRNTLISHR